MLTLHFFSGFNKLRLFYSVCGQEAVKRRHVLQYSYDSIDLSGRLRLKVPYSVGENSIPLKAVRDMDDSIMYVTGAPN